MAYEIKRILDDFRSEIAGALREAVAEQNRARAELADLVQKRERIDEAIERLQDKRRELAKKPLTSERDDEELKLIAVIKDYVKDGQRIVEKLRDLETDVEANRKPKVRSSFENAVLRALKKVESGDSWNDRRAQYWLLHHLKAIWLEEWERSPTTWFSDFYIAFPWDFFQSLPVPASFQVEGKSDASAFSGVEATDVITNATMGAASGGLRGSTPDGESGEESDAALQAFDAFVHGMAEISRNALGQLASGAFDAYANAVDDAITTGDFAGGQLGSTLRSLTSSTLRSIGQQATVKGAFAIGEGVAALAKPDRKAATGHFGSAGKFFAVAALSGAAAGAFSGGESAGGEASSRRREAPSPSGGDAEERDRFEETVVRKIVVFGDSSDEKIKNLPARLAARA